MKGYKFILKHTIPDLPEEQMKEVVNLKLARIIVGMEGESVQNIWFFYKKDV